MLNALIVDDECHCCTVLHTMLEKYCPGIRVAQCCHSGAEALEAIKHLQPGLVFLDVEMPGMSGFEMLEQLPEVNFGLVFTTAYDHYVLKALRLSALDYLLKPIDPEELQKAVHKAALHAPQRLAQQMEVLLQHLNKPSTTLQKIAVPTLEGLQLIPVDTIICCTSDSNYTVIQLKQKQKLVVSRTLKEVEEMLEGYPFVRVHHSHLANVNEISRYIRGEGGYLVMSDGTHLDVSRSRKESLLKKLTNGR